MSRVFKLRFRPSVIPSAARNLLFLLLLLPQFTLAQRPSEPDQELTFAEFRRLLSARAADSGPEAAPRAREIFFALLAAQGREAAARQSLDRLEGWTKAAQARLDAQSTPPLDVEMLRFAEAKAAARVERFEAERYTVLSRANGLLGREPRSPLLAVSPETPASAAPAQTDTHSAGAFAARIAHLEQELLPQAQDLLAKIYQNYLFGGVTLTALLWQEDQTYQTELQYRLLLVEAEQSRASGD